MPEIRRFIDRRRITEYALGFIKNIRQEIAKRQEENIVLSIKLASDQDFIISMYRKGECNLEIQIPFFIIIELNKSFYK